ncbi:hypothetical protein J6590_050792 [Homalodisca vitripennis]|nr:hypothetical protein J6590_050792 [Homalodisca vitripennis]
MEDVYLWTPCPVVDISLRHLWQPLYLAETRATVAATFLISYKKCLSNRSINGRLSAVPWPVHFQRFKLNFSRVRTRTTKYCQLLVKQPKLSLQVYQNVGRFSCTCNNKATIVRPSISRSVLCGLWRGRGEEAREQNTSLTSARSTCTHSRVMSSNYAPDALQ